MKVDWGVGDIPRLDGRTAIVTGASGGVGRQVALQLAVRGAHVVLASRDEDRTRQTALWIREACPGASVKAMRLDLAEFASIDSFARAFADRHHGLDILVNNAGISGGPRRQTADGVEMLFQVNYLGHFALTGLLLPLLTARPGARVVTVSSDIAAMAQIDFDDLQATRRYGLVRTYAQSKLAGLIFAIELERRARSARGHEQFRDQSRDRKDGFVCSENWRLGAIAHVTGKAAPDGSDDGWAAGGRRSIAATLSGHRSRGAGVKLCGRNEMAETSASGGRPFSGARVRWHSRRPLMGGIGRTHWRRLWRACRREFSGRRGIAALTAGVEADACREAIISSRDRQ